eukprot:TRINITY_DN78928_c0_g1_i1.p1 TRINITY_DN78928_c0_g1~~TRINITY_DN78928_c0_g1_i1.p1  ORF type:complete len:405 (+),score=83.68 TRINITY_DN78928_c0_g1_i1:33-1217(+)
MPKDGKSSSKSKSQKPTTPKDGKDGKDAKDKAEKAKLAGLNDKPALAAKIIEVRDTYGKMAAKTRGVRLHTGPLKLRQSLPARDCTSWVRQDKQYNPYSYFESPANKPTPKPPKPKGPPPLWLPPTGPTGKGAERSSPKKTDKPKLADFDETTLGRKPWDTDHHIMVSRMNHEVQTGVREYFDVPKRKEGEGIPKMRERYVMNDRQSGWNDLPGMPGEARKTLFDSIGPYNLGGCKVQQLPSYWRKVKDWGSLSTPEMPSLALSGSKSGPGMDKKSLLQSLANTPGPECVKFWRTWAENGNNFANTVEAEEAESLKSQLTKWDDSWNITWSQGNDELNQRCREYFSVPFGGTGRSTEASKTPASYRQNPLAATFEEGMRALNMSGTLSPSAQSY